MPVDWPFDFLPSCLVFHLFIFLLYLLGVLGNCRSSWSKFLLRFLFLLVTAQVLCSCCCLLCPCILASYFCFIDSLLPYVSEDINGSVLNFFLLVCFLLVDFWSLSLGNFLQIFSKPYISFYNEVWKMTRVTVISKHLVGDDHV